MFVKFPTTALRWMWPNISLDGCVVIMFTQGRWHFCSEVIFTQSQPGRKETSTVLLSKPTQFSRGTARFGAMLGKQHFGGWSCLHLELWGRRTPPGRCNAQHTRALCRPELPVLCQQEIAFPFVWNTVILRVRTMENKSTTAPRERRHWQTAYDSLWIQRNSLLSSNNHPQQITLPTTEY